MCLGTCFYNNGCWGESVYFVECAAANMWVTKTQTFNFPLQWFLQYMLQCTAHWIKKTFKCMFSSCQHSTAHKSGLLFPWPSNQFSLLTTHSSLGTPFTHFEPLITHTWKLLTAQMCEQLNGQQFLEAAPAPVPWIFHSRFQLGFWLYLGFVRLKQCIFFVNDSQAICYSFF